MPKKFQETLNNKLNLEDVINEYPNFARMYRDWGGRNQHILTWLTGYLTALLDTGKIGHHDHIAMVHQLDAMIEKRGETQN